MLVQWCYKGVGASRAFGDQEAAAALEIHGLQSAWLQDQQRQMPPRPPTDLFAAGHAALGPAALDAHVNAFATVKATTPYLSLSAGQVVRDPLTGATTAMSGLATALAFATGAVWGTPRRGYVFRLWVLVAPKPVAELPGFAEEVRELNQFRQFGRYHEEGEIAAKLVVPPRQIERVTRYDATGAVDQAWTLASTRAVVSGGHLWNRDFVPPERITNLREAV